MITGKFIDIDDNTTQPLRFANLPRLFWRDHLQLKASSNEILIVIDRHYLFESVCQDALSRGRANHSCVLSF